MTVSETQRSSHIILNTDLELNTVEVINISRRIIKWETDVNMMFLLDGYKISQFKSSDKSESVIRGPACTHHVFEEYAGELRSAAVSGD